MPTALPYQPWELDDGRRQSWWALVYEGSRSVLATARDLQEQDIRPQS